MHMLRPVSSRASHHGKHSCQIQKMPHDPDLRRRRLWLRIWKRLKEEDLINSS